MVKEIPDRIKCKKCGTATIIPDNIVIRYHHDGDSVFSDSVRKIADKFKPSITIYCSNCSVPVYKIEFNEDDLITIDEETALKIEVLEDMKDFIEKNKKN